MRADAAFTTLETAGKDSDMGDTDALKLPRPMRQFPLERGNVPWQAHGERVRIQSWEDTDVLKL